MNQASSHITSRYSGMGVAAMGECWYTLVRNLLSEHVYNKIMMRFVAVVVVLSTRKIV